VPLGQLSAQQYLDDIDRITRDPNVDLLETPLEFVFEGAHECQALGRVWRIDENAHEVIAVGLALVAPKAANGLSFGGDGAELLLQFELRAR